MAPDGAQREAGRPGEGAAAPCPPRWQALSCRQCWGRGAVGGCSVTGEGPAQSASEAARLQVTLLAQHGDTPTGTKN